VTSVLIDEEKTRKYVEEQGKEKDVRKIESEGECLQGGEK
jgi:hypothetical protein